MRRRVTETIEHAKRHSAARRARTDEAARAYSIFLDTIAVPLMRQIANVLKAQGYAFSVSTPGGSVRLASDKSADDYIELSLDSSADPPAVVASVRRTRGRRVIDDEHPLHAGAVSDIREEELLQAVLRELAPFVER